MTPRLLLRPETHADLSEAFQWYEERSVGLGHEYLRVVRVALAAVERTPDAFPVVLDDIDAEFSHGDHTVHVDAVDLRLSDVPCSPLKYDRPADVARRLLTGTA